jgi:AraC-like DNA-binding protein
MKFLLFLFTINVALGFFLGLAILFRPSLKSITNKYLGYAILTISLLMLNRLLAEVGIYEESEKLRIIDNIEWVFLTPVFIFLFVIKSINHNLNTYNELKLLYLPFIASLLLNSIHNLERDFDIFIFTNEIFSRIKFSLFVLESKLVYIYNFFLMTYLYFILKNSDSQKSKNWLWRLHFIVSSLIGLWILLDFTEGILVTKKASYYTIILFIGISFFLYWVSYYTIYNRKLYAEANEIKQILKTQELNISKTPNSSNTIFEKFESLFKEEYEYRNPNVTRESTAERLGISAGYLSQIINSNTEDNFSSYVNQYRVEEAKKMLHDNTFDKYNIESIGLEAGFSSKTTFHKVFKKFTGITPRAYKNKNK